MAWEAPKKDWTIADGVGYEDFNRIESNIDDLKTSQGKPLGPATLGADGKVPQSQLNITPPVDATINVKGLVKLNNTVTSTLITEAATANAAKLAYDRGQLGYSTAVNANSIAADAIGRIGSTEVKIGLGATAGSRSVAIGYVASANQYDMVALGYGANASMYSDGKLGVEKNYSGPWNWIIPGQLSVAGLKNFEIEHPHPSKKDTHKIRHGAVESPTAGDTLYRFHLKFVDGNAHVVLYGMNVIVILPVDTHGERLSVSIPLPDYWVHLNTNDQVMVNPDKHFGAGFGSVNYNNETLDIVVNTEESYNIVLFGTRDDEGVQEWYNMGVERNVGESWDGETYLLDTQEILTFSEYAEEEE